MALSYISLPIGVTLPPKQAGLGLPSGAGTAREVFFYFYSAVELNTGLKIKPLTSLTESINPKSLHHLFSSVPNGSVQVS